MSLTHIDFLDNTSQVINDVTVYDISPFIDDDIGMSPTVLDSTIFGHQGLRLYSYIPIWWEFTADICHMPSTQAYGLREARIKFDTTGTFSFIPIAGATYNVDSYGVGLSDTGLITLTKNNSSIASYQIIIDQYWINVPHIIRITRSNEGIFTVYVDDKSYIIHLDNDITESINMFLVASSGNLGQTGGSSAFGVDYIEYDPDFVEADFAS